MARRIFSRRDFTRKTAIGAAFPLFHSFHGLEQPSLKSAYKGNLKISLNAFSFDKPLRAGTMTLDDLLEYCAKTGFDGVDLTGYYFPVIRLYRRMNIFIISGREHSDSGLSLAAQVSGMILHGQIR
jgi:hypothetical protein